MVDQGVKMAGFWLLLLLAPCIVQVAMADLRDGTPRPLGYPERPTTSYGPTPPCAYQNGRLENCDWYGWAHIDHPVDGRTCLTYTRAILANTTRVPLGALEPFAYYYLDVFVFNTTTNDSFCIYGCFDMSGAGTPPMSAPPPATVALPPPPATPPVSITPAPSALLPPPPGVLLAPPPATSSAPLPGAVAPATATPPPPPPPTNTRMVFAGAGILQPRGFVSFFISGALLALHGILGF